MVIHFRQSSQFESIRKSIEQHLFDSIIFFDNNLELAIRSVEQFAKSIELMIDTFEQMYQNLKPNDSQGEKSFPIKDGRYRVYYKITANGEEDLTITLLDIDDNKQSNKDRFPTHLITFDIDE